MGVLVCVASVLAFDFKHNAKHSFKLRKPNLGTDQPRWVRIPTLGWEWSECVHEVASGTHVEKIDEDSFRITHPTGETEVRQCVRPGPRPHPFHANPNDPDSTFDYGQFVKEREEGQVFSLEGWQAWTAFNHPQNSTFDYYLGYFNVPVAPSRFPGERIGIVYTFTGLQNDNWVPDYSTFDPPSDFDIIQPVLQYGGGSENGGGEYWELASWYVTVSAGALYSRGEKVATGDNIFGNMTRTGSDSWFIGGVISEKGINTNITVTKSRLTSQSWAYNTLECYSLSSCDYLPPHTSPQLYTKLEMGSGGQDITPDWKILQNRHNYCNASMAVNAPDHVTLFFQ